MADNEARLNFSETTMRDFYTVVFRHKRKMIVFFLSLVIVVAMGTFLEAKVYRSEAELLVRLGRENATVGPTVATGRVINISADRENEINSEVDILESRELAKEVVEAIGAKPILYGEKETLRPGASLPTVVRYWARQAVICPLAGLSRLLAWQGAATPAGRLLEKELAIESLMKRLDVEASKKSNIITIKYATNDPALARKVLNRLVGFYLEKHIEVNHTPGSYTFFRKQKNKLRASLDHTEEELRDLKNSTGVSSVSEQRRILLERIGAMQSGLEKSQSSAAASQARVEVLAATLARLPGVVRKQKTTGFASSAADSLRKQVYALELKEQKLLSIFTANSIPVLQIRRRIKGGKALLSKAQQQKQITTGINDNYQKIELALLSEKANLASLKAREAQIGSHLKSAGQKLDSLNDTQLRFEQLDRDLAVERSSYRKYSDSLEQARIDEALDMQRISNISIVEPASYSVEPVGPKTLLNLCLGFSLGICGALGLAFFCESKDHSLKKPEDVANRLRLPVVAAFPVVLPEKASDGLLLGDPRPLLVESGCELLMGTNGKSVVIGDLLRLCLRAVPEATRAIALVGCHTGEGVSTAAALLAGQLAKTGEGRVLLIDANCLRPCQHVKFGAGLSPGLSDFGANGRLGLACIQSTAVENLDILSAGTSGQTLIPNALNALCDSLPALRRQYGAIICDLPPVLEQGPAMRIAGAMDGVFLVVEAEKTRREVANKAREALVQADANIIGVILNKRRFHIPEWLYKTL